MDLEAFFKKNNKLAIAFSGGVDSAYLLFEAHKNKAEVTAYYVKSQFQPEFEYEDAKRLVEEIKANLKIIELDVLKYDDVVRNDEKRCYYCKQKIFGAICKAAMEDDYNIVADGTNASDDVNDRPGMEVLRELSVVSPLRECGLTKDNVRMLSKEAGLFTWDKPAYAWLATRIKPYEKIEPDTLKKVERSEEYLKEIGFINHRVRVSEDVATVIADKNQVQLLSEKKDIIEPYLKKIFKDVILCECGR